MNIALYHVYPQHTDFVPAADMVESGRVWLEQRFSECSVTWASYEHPHFLHSGDAFVRVRCPLCDQELDTRDWQDMMELVFSANAFRELDVALPCCGGQTSLNRLIYSAHCAFASCCYTVKLLSASAAHFPDKDAMEQSLAELSAIVPSPEGWGLVAEEH